MKSMLRPSGASSLLRRVATRGHSVSEIRPRPGRNSALMSVKRDIIQAAGQVLGVDVCDQEREGGKEEMNEREGREMKEREGREMKEREGGNERERGKRNEREGGKGTEHTRPKGCIMEGCTAHVMVLEPRSAA